MIVQVENRYETNGEKPNNHRHRNHHNKNRKQHRRFENNDDDDGFDQQEVEENFEQRREDEDEGFRRFPRLPWVVSCDFCFRKASKTGSDAGVAADKARKEGFYTLHSPTDQISDPKKWHCGKCPIHHSMVESEKE